MFTVLYAVAVIPVCLILVNGAPTEDGKWPESFLFYFDLCLFFLGDFAISSSGDIEEALRKRRRRHER